MICLSGKVRLAPSDQVKIVWKSLVRYLSIIIYNRGWTDVNR